MPRYHLVLATLIASLVLGACRWGGQTPADISGPDDTSAPEAGETVTISFLAQERERRRYEPLIDRFHAENPDVRVQLVSHDEVMGIGGDSAISPEQRMQRVVNAADTATAFSISAEDIENGYLFDLAPLMDADPSFARDDLYPGILESVSQDDGIYMLPNSMYIAMLSYNKDLWAAAGLPAPDPNWSWNDMIGAAEQLAQTRSNKGEIYGYLGSGSGFLPLVAEAANAGLDLYATPAEELDLEQPAFVATLERVAALAESGAIFVDTESTAPSSVEEEHRMVPDGQVGMWNTGTLFWRPDEVEPQFAVGTAALPPQLGPSFTNTQGYIISSGTQYPQQAWRWIEFLSRQELQDEFGPGNTPNQIPARASVAEASGYWSELDDETAAAIRAVLNRPAQPTAQNTLSSANVFEPLTEALQDVIQGDQTAEAALREAQAALEAQLAEVQQTPESTSETGPIVVATPIVEVVPEGTTQITFSTSGLYLDDLRRVAREFNQHSSNIFVDVHEIDASTGPIALSNIASNSDCFIWWDSPSTEELTAVLDLQPLIDADVSFDGNDYPPALLTPFRHEAGLNGLPYTLDLQTLTYNQTAFDAAGLDYPTGDWTLDEFLNAAQHLTIGEGRNQQYGYISLGHQTQELFFFLRRSGVALVQGNGEATQPNFTDPEVVQAIQYYVDLLRDFSPSTQLRGESFALISLLGEGRAGMWFDFGFGFGSSMDVSSIGDANPDFRLGIAPPPLGDSTIGAQDVNVQALYISATTQHPEACWTWLKHLSVDTSALKNSFPARISVAESAAFADQAPPGAAEVLAAYRDVLTRPPTRDDESASSSQADIDYFWLYQAVDQAIHGETDLESGLAAAQRMTEEYMACMHSSGEGAANTCAAQVDPDYDGRQHLLIEEETEVEE